MHYNYALNNSPVYDYRTNTGNGWRTKSGCTMQEAILAENWDFISLQQGTGTGVALRSRSPIQIFQN